MLFGAVKCKSTIAILLTVEACRDNQANTPHLHFFGTTLMKEANSINLIDRSVKRTYSGHYSSVRRLTIQGVSKRSKQFEKLL